MKDKVIIGIDGGGTFSRVAVTDDMGHLLSYVNKNGGANITKDLKAKENVHNAIKEALLKAQKTIKDVYAITVGVAGYDDDEDLEWVKTLIDIEGLDCKKAYLNDAVIAQIGAFISAPGIIAIAGTGCVIFGINEDNRQIKNYDFEHKSRSHARGLSSEAVYRIIAGEKNDSDNELVTLALDYFNVGSISELALLGADGFRKEEIERNKFFGDFGPVITEQALKGSHIAQKTCINKSNDIVRGIRLVGECFKSDIVPVAFIGSVANSKYMHDTMLCLLKENPNKNYQVSSPVFPAVIGSVVIAMKESNIEISNTIIKNLKKSAELIKNQ